MKKNILLLLLLACFSKLAFADYFKWELLVSAEGFGTVKQIIPIKAEGDIQKFGKKGQCKVDRFWRKIESEMLLESKTLTCSNGKQERSIQVICTDNFASRKYNYSKKLYPESRDGFALDPDLGADSPYLELRCYF